MELGAIWSRLFYVTNVLVHLWDAEDESVYEFKSGARLVIGWPLCCWLRMSCSCGRVQRAEPSSSRLRGMRCPVGPPGALLAAGGLCPHQGGLPPWLPLHRRAGTLSCHWPESCAVLCSWLIRHVFWVRLGALTSEVALSVLCAVHPVLMLRGICKNVP